MKNLDKVIFFLSIAGLTFSGYLSFYKLINQECALNETCPYFLGFPACYYGFVMYIAITILAATLVFKQLKKVKALNYILIVSGMGILFSGYFTLPELPILFEKGLSAYALVLPTCALGLIFYILIFSLSAILKFKK